MSNNAAILRAKQDAAIAARHPEIERLRGEGLSADKIAAALGLARQTYRAHRRRCLTCAAIMQVRVSIKGKPQASHRKRPHLIRGEAQRRACLRCDRLFLSPGFQVRLCDACRQSLVEFPVEDEPYPLLIGR